jgi:hypothetical protein
MIPLVKQANKPKLLGDIKSMSFEIAKKILDAHRGATFVKADLHIHTPGSFDWGEKNPDPAYKSKNIRPEQFVEAAIAKGLGMIAITDHNSVEWCERVMRAAQGTSLTVLPGFELTVKPGVHVLGLFDTTTPIEKLRGLLQKLGIENDRMGDPVAFTDIPIEDPDYRVTKAITNAGGIAIPAHINLASGLVGRLKAGPAVEEFLRKSGCDILEVPLKKIPDLVKDMLRKDPTKFAIIDGSDAHQLQEIGNNNLWLKMDTIGLNGVKQLPTEPLKRIQYSDVSTNTKLKILGMYTNGGILKDQVIPFNSELNCLIGGRGAGKSIVVDYLRFVFSNEPADEDLKSRLYDRFADLIRLSTDIYVLVEDCDGKLWLYERKLRFEKKKVRGSRETVELKSEPANIFQIIMVPPQAVKLNDNLPDHRFEFYGQGEVQSITETAEPGRQLKLVDDFIQSSLEQRHKKSRELELDLNESEIRICGLETEISILDAEISNLLDLQTRINEIEQALDTNNITGHQVWEDANQWIEEAGKHFHKQKEILKGVVYQGLDEKDFQFQAEDASAAFEDLANKVCQAIGGLVTTDAETKKKIEEIDRKIIAAKKRWDLLYNQEAANFTELLRKQGVENLASLNIELAEKKHERDTINQVKVPRLSQASIEKDALVSERRIKLSKLISLRNEITDMRIAAAQRMTMRLSQAVEIEILPKQNSNAYFDFLFTVAPIGIQKKDEQIQKVVERMTPIELAKAILEKDMTTIMERTGVTKNTAETLTKITLAEIMNLEKVQREDFANVYLILEGRRKPLSDLSQGEKCTAILSVILLDEYSPLIIDQPEDELDHNFIMANVVDTIGNVKQKCHPLEIGYIPKYGRQFIISTHNQNIPVLGDAELVLKMRKVTGEDKCEIECGHGLEHHKTILHILSLEGGNDAFERRRRKYELARC